ncbi:hypothetical protein L7F22_022632 [Adiantum nelumboides]|nr:hypothetical protein [Adiantum nelumboides]
MVTNYAQLLLEIGSTYTARFRVLNISNWSQRIRVLQRDTTYFHVTYGDLCPQGVILAPGKSCKFTVAFLADTGVDINANLVVKCEMCSIKLVMAAKNPFPWVEIPPMIDIGPCLVGHEISILLPVLSKGAGGTFRLSSPIHDLEEKVLVPNNLYKILKAQQFIVYPNHFKLRKDESGDVVVLFMPQSAGQVTLSLKISTECGLEWSTQIKGFGVYFDISVQDIEYGRIFKSQEEGELDFGSATALSRDICKKLLVKNNMPLSVRYFWTVKDSISRVGCCEKKTAVFSINPCFGVLDSDMSVFLTITFTPDLPRYCQQLASLYIDTRSVHPLQSPRWTELQGILHSRRMKLLALKDGSAPGMKGKISKEDGNEKHLVSYNHVVDTTGIVWKLMDLKLSGVGEPLQVELVPPILHLLDIVEQGQSYTTSVLLRNNSGVDVSFSWKLPNVPCNVKLKSNQISISPSTGTLNAMGMRNFQVCLKARTIGTLRERLICQINGGPEPVLYIEGFIRGPSVEIAPAILDFGIVQVQY